MSYEFWHAALAGKPVTIHENDPQPGYYRVREGKGGPWVPVALWEEPEGMVAKRGEAMVDAHEIWTWCCRNPVTYETYTAVRRGEPWPDDARGEIEAARAEIGHNSGLPQEEIRDEIEAADRAFVAWLTSIGGAVSSEEQDAKAEDFRTRLHALGKKAEDARVAEKAPHLQACKDIDGKWKPVVEAAEAGKKRIGGVVVSYRVERDKARKAEEARRAEEARKALEEEARKAFQAAQAAGEPDPAAAAAQVVAQAPAPVAAGYVAKPRKGFRTVEVCVVDDPVAAACDILGKAPTQPDLLEAIRLVAHRMLKSGVTIEGARLATEQRV